MKISLGGSEYEIRTYRASDEPGVVALHRLVFGDHGEVARRLRDWRYNRNPAGAHRTELCLTARGEIVCSYTGLPMRGVVAGEPAGMAAIVDSMSHPEYRGIALGRRGLFVRTARSWIERNTGPDAISFCYGTPQDRYGRLGALLLGYHLWDDILVYTRDLEDSLAKRVRRKLGGGGIEEVRSFGREADDLWARVARTRPTAVIRDSRHLEWRYGAAADQANTTLVARAGDGAWRGWLALHRGPDGIVTVVDAIVPRDPLVAARLLYRAILRTLELGSRRIEGWAIPGGQVARMYEDAGFWKRANPNRRVRFACGFLADERAVRDSLYFQPGDTDEF